MPKGPVIANNTPIAALWSVSCLKLLEKLYGEVLIPETVCREFLATEYEIRQKALTNAPWIKPTRLKNPQQVLLYTSLDRGEAEVLALANELAARLVIIDERKARSYAKRLGLPLTGTLGVVLTAKEKGLISAVKPLINNLVNEGFYVSPELVRKAIKLAGE